MADRKCRKWVDHSENRNEKVFWVAGYEFPVKIQKSKIADPKWRTGNVESWSMGLKIGERGIFGVLVTNLK